MLRKILIFIPMLFCILMGSLAFLSPDIIGGILGVSADNAAGRGTISGDFGAMFFTGAGAAALALFKGKSKLLWVSISLLGLTLLGRLFEITSTGIGETTLQPIIIEAVLVAMLLTALKLSKEEA
ncbi:hypothetical protein [Hellea balneolensis]|uniref:hypothetical protein n=1 Tax=Hellea balneolensis TaxID=287478 RepID=UPI00047A9B0E|nr:hypothetical protein [Hellea balneolensis]